MEDINPVPIFWSTVSCGNLAEVVIREPKHCKVSFLNCHVLVSQGDAVGWTYNTSAAWAVIELGGRFELTNAIA